MFHLHGVSLCEEFANACHKPWVVFVKSLQVLSQAMGMVFLRVLQMLVSLMGNFQVPAQAMGLVFAGTLQVLVTSPRIGPCGEPGSGCHKPWGWSWWEAWKCLSQALRFVFVGSL